MRISGESWCRSTSSLMKMCWFVQKVSAKGDSDPAVTQPWDECHSSSAADIKRVQSFFLPIPLTFYTALSCYSRCFPVWSNSVKHQDSRELLQLSCSSLLCSNENEKRFTVRQVTVNSGCDALWMILMDDPLCAAPHTLPQQTQNISRVQNYNCLWAGFLWWLFLGSQGTRPLGNGHGHSLLLFYRHGHGSNQWTLLLEKL